MPDDLLRQLQQGSHWQDIVMLGGVKHDARCLAAADEIKRLQAENERLRVENEKLRADVGLWVPTLLASTGKAPTAND